MLTPPIVMRTGQRLAVTFALLAIIWCSPWGASIWVVCVSASYHTTIKDSQCIGALASGCQSGRYASKFANSGGYAVWLDVPEVWAW